MKDLAVPQPASTPAAIPFSDLEKMATAIARSQLFGVKEPVHAVALFLIAQAEGMHPALAARDYDVIQGRPAKKAESIQRSFQSAGGKIEWHRLDNEVADATFSHPLGGSFRCTWDMERANQAGLSGKDMWRKYPRQMLRSRCVSEGCRTVYPGSTSGMYTAEEVRDMQPEREVPGEVVSLTRQEPTAVPKLHSHPPGIAGDPPIGSKTPEHRAIFAKLTQYEVSEEGGRTWCEREFGTRRFSQLTHAQQSRLMSAIPGMALAKLRRRINALTDSAELSLLARTLPVWMTEDDKASITLEIDERMSAIAVPADRKEDGPNE